MSASATVEFYPNTVEGMNMAYRAVAKGGFTVVPFALNSQDTYALVFQLLNSEGKPVMVNRYPYILNQPVASNWVVETYTLSPEVPAKYRIRRLDTNAPAADVLMSVVPTVRGGLVTVDKNTGFHLTFAAYPANA